MCKNLNKIIYFTNLHNYGIVVNTHIQIKTDVCSLTHWSSKHTHTYTHTCTQLHIQHTYFTDTQIQTTLRLHPSSVNQIRHHPSNPFHTFTKFKWLSGFPLAIQPKEVRCETYTLGRLLFYLCHRLTLVLAFEVNFEAYRPTVSTKVRLRNCTKRAAVRLWICPQHILCRQGEKKTPYSL